MVAAAKKKRLGPKRGPKGITCCGVLHEWGVWVFAHTRMLLIFTCPKCKKTLEFTYR